MTLDQLLTQFLDHLRYERNLSAHTLRNYESDLRQFLDYLVPPKEDATPVTKRELSHDERAEPNIKQVDHLTIREWLSSLHSGHKKTSIARKLAALRTFFQFLVREGVVELNPAKLVATPRKEKKLPVHLSIEDAVRFIETPDTETDFGKRDRAILELLAHGTFWRSGSQGFAGLSRGAQSLFDEGAGYKARRATPDSELSRHANDHAFSRPAGRKIHSTLRRHS